MIRSPNRPVLYLVRITEVHCIWTSWFYYDFNVIILVTNRNYIPSYFNQKLSYLQSLKMLSKH